MYHAIFHVIDRCVLDWLGTTAEIFQCLVKHLLRIE